MTNKLAKGGSGVHDMQVALLLLDLQLGECGQQALQRASMQLPEQQGTDSSALELSLCCSRAASLVGDEEGALPSPALPRFVACCAGNASSHTLAPSKPINSTPAKVSFHVSYCHIFAQQGTWRYMCNKLVWRRGNGSCQGGRQGS